MPAMVCITGMFDENDNKTSTPPKSEKKEKKKENKKSEKPKK